MPSPATRHATHILDVIQQLSHLPSLAPTPRVNNLFTCLVGLTEPHHLRTMEAEDVLSLLPLNDIHNLCAKGESELEIFWANRIPQSPNPQQTLQEFPYHQNYELQVEMETALLSRLNFPKQGRALFIGSGPLPLTAHLMETIHNIPTDCLDISPQAHTLADAWQHRINPHRKGTSLTAAAEEFKNYQAYEAILLGAMVGRSEEEKRQLMHRISSRMAPHAILLTRSTSGLRQILYPQSPTQAEGLIHCATAEPTNQTDKTYHQVIHTIHAFTRA